MSQLKPYTHEWWELSSLWLFYVSLKGGEKKNWRIAKAWKTMAHANKFLPFLNT